MVKIGIKVFKSKLLFNLYSFLNFSVWSIFFSFQILLFFDLSVANSLSFFVLPWLLYNFMQNFIPSVFLSLRICLCM